MISSKAESRSCPLRSYCRACLFWRSSTSQKSAVNSWYVMKFLVSSWSRRREERLLFYKISLSTESTSWKSFRMLTVMARTSSFVTRPFRSRSKASKTILNISRSFYLVLAWFEYIVEVFRGYSGIEDYEVLSLGVVSWPYFRNLCYSFNANCRFKAGGFGFRGVSW